MGKPSAPAAPNYVGAAQATAQGNLDQTRAALAGSLIGQNTPYGSLSYKQTGTDKYGNPMWTAEQTLSPEQQALYQSGSLAAQRYADLANQGLMNVGQLLAHPGIDQSRLAQAPVNAGQTAQQAVMSRLAPDIAKQNAAFESQMASQGISPGTEAYRTAKAMQDQQHNDMMLQAGYQGIGIDQSARQQGISEQLAQQNQIMNLLNALRTGSQVQNPNFINTPQQQAAAGADYLGAASAQGLFDQGIYNARMGGSSGMNSGLFNLAGSLIGRYSDRRLKRNIERIGTHKLGIGIYKFEYVWGEPSIGVMADEVRKVMPDAVMTQPNGFDMVDYGKLG